MRIGLSHVPAPAGGDSAFPSLAVLIRGGRLSRRSCTDPCVCHARRSRQNYARSGQTLEVPRSRRGSIPAASLHKWRRLTNSRNKNSLEFNIHKPSSSRPNIFQHPASRPRSGPKPYSMYPMQSMYNKLCLASGHSWGNFHLQPPPHVSPLHRSAPASALPGDSFVLSCYGPPLPTRLHPIAPQGTKLSSFGAFSSSPLSRPSSSRPLWSESSWIKLDQGRSRQIKVKNFPSPAISVGLPKPGTLWSQDGDTNPRGADFYSPQISPSACTVGTP
jgi:hypothetical protein